MSKNNILIAGTGQIGSRHLQGLVNSDIPYNVVIVDPDIRNIKTALERAKEIGSFGIHKIYEYQTLDAIPVWEFQVAIIATNANIRAEVTKQLIAKLKVNNLIFEKVAFQSEKQFLEIIELLNKNKIKSWVNCPRRTYPYYKDLKNYLHNKGTVSLEVTGENWGMACNSIHFIDLISFLTDDRCFHINSNLLDKKIYESKRKNYVEFFGSFTGQSDRQNSFSFSCNHGTDNRKSFLVRIRAGQEEITINEIDATAVVRQNKSGEIINSKKINILYQSQMTHQQVKQIIETKSSELPSIEESFELHKPMFKLFSDHIQNVTGEKLSVIPIT